MENQYMAEGLAVNIGEIMEWLQNQVREKGEFSFVKISNCHKGKKLVPLLTLSILLTASAYAATPPNTGTAIESAKPPVIRQPVVQAPSITVEGQAPSSQAEGGQRIFVKVFRISGESPVSADELLKLLQDKTNKEIFFGELNHIAAKITQHLRQQGYLVAFAYIPPQDIQNGIVEIAVVPGKYGQIKITGTGHISHDRLKAMLFTAKSGMVITQKPLERALFLLSDLSGVSVKANLTPGEVGGTADLVLEVTDSQKANGAAYVDNWGNNYTGQARYGTQLTINNVGNIGDTFNLGGLTTADGINDYNFGYSTNIGNDGGKIEVKYSHVGYTLGGTFSNLGATGRAAITSYSFNYPYIRSRAFNLYGTLGYDGKHLSDDTGTSHSPRSTGLWNVGLSGNFADHWLGGGMNAFSLTQYWGKLTFHDDDALANDIGNTRGDFSKTVFTYQRQQYMTKDINCIFNFTGQLADKNLDSSEKLYLGGAGGVRAFPQGEAAGDQGYKLTVELRCFLPQFSTAKNSLYVNGFYDYGSVIVNHQPYSTDTNRRSLMGAGLGLLWTCTQDFAIRLDYAWKIGEETATADSDKNGRAWLQAITYF